MFEDCGYVRISGKVWIYLCTGFDICEFVVYDIRCYPREAVVFEDSDVGFRAAEAAGIEYIKVNSLYFDNGN